MNRRDFWRSASAAVLGGLLPPPMVWGSGVGRTWAAPAEASVNAERLLRRFHSLAEFGRTPAGGISRVAFSEADRAVRARVTTWLEKAGLSVHVDVAGNVVGERPGSVAGLRPLILGSHIDSVPDGGNFDGQVGSVGAVEVAQALADASVQLRHPLQVMFFTNEENGKTGSRALVGEVAPFELARVMASGLTIGEGIRMVGGDPDRLAEAQREPGSIAGFLELHIEQGGVLDAAGIPIGVVEGIVGIRRWTATIQGAANHAGTTPMAVRRDAMLGAADLILAVNRSVRGIEGSQVGTVGTLQAEPGAPNVIPGQVSLSIEVRALSMETIDEVFRRIEAEAARITESRDLNVDFEQFYVSYAAPTEERFRRYVEGAAEALGLRARRMPSGAGHDAQSMARLGPIGMIFVPSVQGISHSPLEKTEDDAIVKGTRVLLHALLAADASESP